MVEGHILDKDAGGFMPDYSNPIHMMATHTFAPVGSGDKDDGIRRVIIDSVDPTLDPESYNPSPREIRGLRDFLKALKLEP